MSPTTTSGAVWMRLSVGGEHLDDRPDRALVAVEPSGQVGAGVGVRIPRDPVGTLNRELRAIVQMAGVRQAVRRGRAPRDARRIRGVRVRLRLGSRVAYLEWGVEPNVRLGGSSGSGRASCAPPRCRSADTGSTTLDPTTTAMAGAVRVANLRLRAVSAANRRRREASSPVSNRGRSIAPPATASAPRLRGCSRNQSTFASNHTSPDRHPMRDVPSPAAPRVLRPDLEQHSRACRR